VAAAGCSHFSFSLHVSLQQCGEAELAQQCGTPTTSTVWAIRALADAGTILLLPWSTASPGACAEGSPLLGEAERSVPRLPAQQLLVGAAGVAFFAAG